MSKQFTKLINNSTIAKDEANVFVNQLSLLPEKELAFILELLEGDPSLFEALYTNYQDKSEAFETCEPALLEQILEKEKELLI